MTYLHCQEALWQDSPGSLGIRLTRNGWTPPLRKNCLIIRFCCFVDYMLLRLKVNITDLILIFYAVMKSDKRIASQQWTNGTPKAVKPELLGDLEANKSIIINFLEEKNISMLWRSLAFSQHVTFPIYVLLQPFKTIITAAWIRTNAKSDRFISHVDADSLQHSHATRIRFKKAVIKLIPIHHLIFIICMIFIIYHFEKCHKLLKSQMLHIPSLPNIL